MSPINEKPLILMVDGDVSFLDSALTVLRKEFGSQNVMGTTHPAEAADWLQESRHALLITEVDLPGLDGPHFVEQALTIDKNLRIIVTTSLSDPWLLTGEESGEFRLLQKPFSFSALSTIVHETIKKPLIRLPRPHAWSRLPTSPRRHRSTKHPGVSHMTGSLKIVSVTELIQLFASSTYQGKLWLTNAQNQTGCLYINSNHIVHIETGDFVGLEALQELNRWHSGTFEWLTNIPGKRTMNMAATDLLLHLHLTELTDVSDLANSEEQFELNGLEGFSEAFEIFEVSDISGHGPDLLVFEEQHPDSDSSLPNLVSPDSLPTSVHPKGKLTMANNVQTVLQSLTSINGFIAAALVDADSGMALGTVGGNNNFNIEIAAATNAEVVKAKMRAMDSLKLTDAIDDILISLGSQYHLVRPLADNPYIFFYLALDRAQSNLAMARLAVKGAAEELKL